jgi:hypothetical protein
LNPGTAIAALLADPAVVLVDLGMLGIHLVAVKIMPVADPTVASQVLRLGICFGLPAAFPLGIFNSHPPLSEMVSSKYNHRGHSAAEPQPKRVPKMPKVP